jgi:hypothetical protein
MNRRTLLLSSVAALLPLARAARAQEQVSADYLKAVQSSKERVDGMLLAVDTVRLLLALAISEGSEALNELATSRESYLQMRERVRAVAQDVSGKLLAQADAGLQLSQESTALVEGVETTLSENGINRDSKLGIELFTSFRTFVKIVEEELAATGVTDWFCRDYPFRALC